MLSQRDIDSFHRDGFLAVERLIDDAAVEELRAAYDEIIDGSVRAPGDRLLGGITRQVKFPSLTHPVFQRNPALEAALAIQAQLYPGTHQARTYDMLISKPAGHPHETPWHQDMGYYDMPVARAGAKIPLGPVQFWLALDDVDLENGCMQFLPGVHEKPLLEHVIASGDPRDEGRLLALRDPSTQVDLGRAVACPLRAGGCTLHTPGTPHYTGPNHSRDRMRRAYIFNLLSGGPEVARLEGALLRGAVAAGALPADALAGD